MTETKLKMYLLLLGLEWDSFKEFIIGKTISSNEKGESIYFDADITYFVKTHFSTSKMIQVHEQHKAVLEGILKITEGVQAYKKSLDGKITEIKCPTVYIEFSLVDGSVESQVKAYNTFLMLFNSYLWSERLGVWGGRETDLKPKVKQTTFFEVNNDCIGTISDKATMLAMAMNVVVEKTISTNVQTGTLKFSDSFSYKKY